MNYFDLIFGIIKSPSKTFEQIIKERNIFVSFLIWLIYSGLYIFTINFLMKISYGDKVQDFNLIFLLIHKKTIFTLFGIYLYVFFLNFFAVKYYKFKSSYIELLSCNLFILTIGILNLCVVILLIHFSAISIINYPMIIFVPWLIILNVLAIKKVYKTSTGIALKIFFFSLSIMFLLLLIDKGINKWIGV
jgi:hypothetical protein